MINHQITQKTLNHKNIKIIQKSNLSIGHKMLKTEITLNLVFDWKTTPGYIESTAINKVTQIKSTIK